MIEEGIIITKSKGVFKFYYPLGFEGEPRKLSPIQEEVFETLQEGPLTSEDLAKTLDRSKASVEYHLRNLMNMGFVERQMVGRKYEWYV